MSLFKKKQGDNIATDNCFPEYHKCPVCGELVKTKPNVIQNYKEKYLDGQRKIPFDVLMNCYNYCDKCGYVYILQDYSKNYEVNNIIKETVKLKEYQNIVNTSNIERNVKFLYLLTEIANCKTSTANNINSLWLMFYEEKKDIENIQKYLLRRIEEVKQGKIFATSAIDGELCFRFYKYDKIHIEEKEVLIDLYRRSGQFAKAKKIIDNETLQNQSDGIKKYYELQQKLIEDYDKRHI